MPLLAIEQKYSKLVDSSQEEITKFQLLAEKVRHEAKQLVLSQARIDRLKSLALPESTIPMVENVHYDGKDILFESRPSSSSKKLFSFRGITQPDGRYAIEILEDGVYRPFEVIDLIPDYDLGFLYVSESEVDLATKDKIPVPDVVPYFIQARISKLESKLEESGQLSEELQKLKMEASSMPSFLAKMDKSLGNLSERMERYLRVLNAAIGRTSSNRMFHHGPDSHNPVSEPGKNFPMTVILPRAIGPLTEKFYLIENPEQLAAFIKVLKNNDYFAPTNPLWGEKVQTVRSDQFTLYSRKTGVPMIPPKPH